MGIMYTEVLMKARETDAGAVDMVVTGVRASKPVNTLNQIYQLQKWQEMRKRTQVGIIRE